MRIYEAAKKYGLKVPEFIKKLNEIGINDKGNFNVLDNDELLKIEQLFKNSSEQNKIKLPQVIKKAKNISNDNNLNEKEVIKEKMVFDKKNTNNNFKNKQNFNKNNKFSRDNSENKPFKKDFVKKDRDNRDNNDSFQKDKNISENKKEFKKDFRKDRQFKDNDKDRDNYDDNKFKKNNKFVNKKENNNKDNSFVIQNETNQKNSKNSRNKNKQNKKKYEYDKKEKEELREINIDYRKDDKKKKSKKKEKELKNEIVRMEDGENSLGMITMKSEISIKDLADKLGVYPSQIISKFFLQGKIFNINTILSLEEAEEVALEYNVIIEKEEVEDISYGEKYNLELEDKEEDLIVRAPIITIMGHVDHGKTSLLDALRHTNVTDTEAGGITQRIGAYQVKYDNRMITFIDTPGHEAFTEMRVRGTNITDIAILVVAADDGVKPQTIEAISHAKAANVPIIVAINKIDKPGINIERVKTELSNAGVLVSDWGGDVECIEISAKQRINLDSLLETILITADILELKANPKKRAKAVVIEAKLDPKMGAVADVLVQEGELKKNDIFVAGRTYGKIRKMIDHTGKEVLKATVSQPVEIFGFSEVPTSGDVLYCVNNEKQAKKIVEDYKLSIREEDINMKKHISLESLSKELENQQIKELKCIIKSDSIGSTEALKNNLLKLNNDEVLINVIQSNTGAINESDIKLAEASSAIIIGFNVSPTTTAKNEAEKAGVEIRTYNVIYQAIEDMENAMKGMLAPKYKEVYLGRMELVQVFKIKNVGNIAGAIVIDGKITRNSKIRLIRDGIIVHTGDISSLKRYKDDAKEVAMGQDCGIRIKDYDDIKQGDIIESYILEEIPR